jgi:hypothetical protein
MNIKIFLLALIFICFGVSSYSQDIYQSTNGEVTFYSEAPIENIEASSQDGISVLNLETGEIVFKIKIRSFNFKKALMQEHFNENYMESEQYPYAEFRGRITNPNALASPGEHSITLIGKLNIHGEIKSRELQAELDNSDSSNLKLKSVFLVKCKDHKIKIPRLLWKNIAEEIKVTINTSYKPLGS